MAGGLIELIAKGDQDTYLTVNPQITFFKMVYKRHTNFSIETVEQVADGTVNFGKKVTFLIGRHGDLIHKMFFKLKILLASRVMLQNIDNNTYANCINNIGHALIEKVVLKIGGTEIDTHYSEWFDIWNELTDYKMEEYDLIGKKVDPRELEFIETNVNEYYIPLKFWFNRNPGLALPLIALQYHEVKLEVDLRNLDSVVTSNKTVSSTINTIDDFNNLKLFVDYIYLDEDERQKFAQNKHTYLIEQVQQENHNNLSTNSNIKLRFNHPVKELIWALRHKDRATKSSTPALNFKASSTNGNDWFNYSGTSVNTNLGLNTYDPFSRANIELNGQDRFELKDALYFRRYQPYVYHSRIPQKHIYCYSFALDPEKSQPTGTCNFSRLDSKKLILKNIVSTDFELLVYAVNYNILNIQSGEANLLFVN